MTGTSIDIINTRSDEVDPATLTLHPQNPRQGDVKLLTSLFQENGFYGRVVVDERAGYVLVGNHRVKAALVLSMPLVPVEYVTTRDDDHATAIMLADNRASDLATNDEVLLAELLEGLARDGGLQGSGYDGDDLDELLREPSWQSGEGGPGTDVKSSTTVRPVIHIATVELVERAFRATGKINRGEAFLVICRSYLENETVG